LYAYWILILLQLLLLHHQRDLLQLQLLRIDIGPWLILIDFLLLK
jgi:hypothetical protein